MDDERPGSLTACAGCRERDARIAESQRRLADSVRRTTELERKLAEVTRESQRHADVQRLAKHLRHHRHERFLFLYDPDIPATNNRAERQIRPGVVLRKLGSCHRKTLHAVAHEITASLTTTCRQKGHPFLKLANLIWLSPQPRAFPCPHVSTLTRHTQAGVW